MHSDASMQLTTSQPVVSSRVDCDAPEAVDFLCAWCPCVLIGGVYAGVLGGA